MTRESNASIFNSRRSLLKMAGGCSVMTNTSLMATLLNLQATKAAMAQESNPTGYKAIVCLFLFGGLDSYQALIPNGGDVNSGTYADYSRLRGGYDDGNNNAGGLALEQSSLIPITGPSSSEYGLPPGFGSESGADPADDPTTTGIAGLYNDNKLSFISNIGSLAERTTRTTYNARTGLPLGLFSHADLQRHWQTGVPESRSQVTGWGGRMADLLEGTNQNPSVSMNISLGGMNIYQTGGSVVPYAIGNSGSTRVTDYRQGLEGGNRSQRMFTRAMDSMLEQTYTDLLAKSFAESSRNSTDAALDFNDSVNAVNLTTVFENESPSNQLKMVAKCIGARSSLQQTRQIFFVSNGGWDNHNNLITAHETKMPQISRALKSFHDATVELGVESEVTLFTASDFARTLGTNGQGSDHAWGGNHMIMGGGVDGGKIFGDYPELTENNPLNLGRGRMIPTTAVDELAAEIATWFGISNDQDMEQIIPNIRRFHAAGGTTGPLGILS